MQSASGGFLSPRPRCIARILPKCPTVALAEPLDYFGCINITRIVISCPIIFVYPWILITHGLRWFLAKELHHQTNFTTIFENIISP
ncbi:MAG: hypothetical protein F6J98_46520 [Moorea sp. SIO4G2]|nr:hypothetical protein [Moorena sp. SIO4G2]